MMRNNENTKKYPLNLSAYITFITNHGFTISSFVNYKAT